MNRRNFIVIGYGMSPLVGAHSVKVLSQHAKENDLHLIAMQKESEENALIVIQEEHQSNQAKMVQAILDAQKSLERVKHQYRSYDNWDSLDVLESLTEVDNKKKFFNLSGTPMKKRRDGTKTPKKPAKRRNRK